MSQTKLFQTLYFTPKYQIHQLDLNLLPRLT